MPFYYRRNFFIICFIVDFCLYIVFCGFLLFVRVTAKLISSNISVLIHGLAIAIPSLKKIPLLSFLSFFTFELSLSKALIFPLFSIILFFLTKKKTIGFPLTLSLFAYGFISIVNRYDIDFFSILFVISSYFAFIDFKNGLSLLLILILSRLTHLNLIYFH